MNLFMNSQDYIIRHNEVYGSKYYIRELVRIGLDASIFEYVCVCVCVCMFRKFV